MKNCLKYLTTLLLTVLVGNTLIAQQSNSEIINSPRLVVVINVEQMRTDYIGRFWNKFQQGGFKRLLEEGAVCSNTSMNLHVQKSITGVATLFTGVYPSRHGIVNDNWYDRLRSKEVNALEDDYYITVGSDSEEGKISASKLLSPTIGDDLKINTRGKSKVFSIALNPESAVFSAGHSADGAYWLDTQTGAMISSSYYIELFPDWVRLFNDKKFAELYTSRDWSTLLPAGSYEESLQDDYILEKGFYNKWNTFPYNINKLKDRAGSYKILKATPFGNTMVKDFAVNLIQAENLGKDNIPDLLTVNFSSMDYENGEFGPVSVEMQDVYLRLDQEIAHLINYLDNSVGKGNSLIVLTSSCSSSYPVDYLKEEYNMPVGYVAPESMVALLKSYLNISYGQNDWIEFVSDQQIYFNRDLIEKKELDLEEVQRKAATFINQFEGVKLALPASSFEQGDYLKSQLTLISNSFNFKRSGDVLYLLEDGWQPQYKYQRTIYTDQVRIPMIWYGAGIRKQRILEKVEAVDVVPTIFEILGYDPPAHTQGRVISELFR
ncbi:alkaline phosphatase family protein [Sunxiuqinia sp. A32]|uniref:alkaline phosphatase family protein n=1 Tax=Sunxiuqinia sp. A32 TaxID=3461496 RepID=UPI004045B4B3